MVVGKKRKEKTVIFTQSGNKSNIRNKIVPNPLIKICHPQRAIYLQLH